MAERRITVSTVTSLVTSPVSSLRSIAVRRGLLGGSRSWMIVAGVLWGARILRRASSRRPEVVALESLKPGQTLQVTAIDPRRDQGQR